MPGWKKGFTIFYPDCKDIFRKNRKITGEEKSGKLSTGKKNAPWCLKHQGAMCRLF